MLHLIQARLHYVNRGGPEARARKIQITIIGGSVVVRVN
jgi:hypothetical protein